MYLKILIQCRCTTSLNWIKNTNHVYVGFIIYPVPYDSLENTDL